MITEDYVSFEVAKLLKEKGFRESCIATYLLSSKQLNIEEIYQDWTSSWSSVISAPTIQMACKWLRETYNKHCNIGYDIDLAWYFQIFDTKETVEYDCTETKCYRTENNTGFKTYEEAVKAALKYALENLI